MSAPARVILETGVNLDEEWPEEDVKPKRGKKEKKSKNAIPDGLEDMMRESSDANAQVEEVIPEAISVKEAEVAAVEPDEDEDLDDGASKVSFMILLRVETYINSPDSYESTKRETEKGEGKGQKEGPSSCEKSTDY